MSLALLCSGQGHQHPQMFRLTGSVPQAQPWFDHAAKLLGSDPRCPAYWHDSVHPFSNRSAQVLCSLQTLAAHAALADVLPRRICIAGYSVGELGAWGAAGAIEPLAILDLAVQRAEAMDAERAGEAQGLLSIRGLTENVISSMCADHGAAIAISNPDAAWIIGGKSEALEMISELARAAGALRVTRLRVDVASHTYLMQAAARTFGQCLARVPLVLRLPSGVRLFSALDGTTVFDLKSASKKLAAQMAHPLLWNACLQGCIEAGASAFLELGPGRALAAMACTMQPVSSARSLEDFRNLESLRAWITQSSMNE